MKKSAENYYKKMISNHISESLNKDDYFQFCLNYTQTHIIECYNNKFPCKDVITELFKRGMAEKWRLDNPDYREKAIKYEKQRAEMNNKK